jgi:hypothetical protein
MAPPFEPSYGGTGAVLVSASKSAGAPVERVLVATGVLPLQSIPAGSSATATVAAVLDCGVVVANGVCVATGSSGIASGQVTFQGSLDGTNWYTIGVATTVAASTTVTIPGTAALPAIGRYFRAIISTVFAGGTVGVMVGGA